MALPPFRFLIAAGLAPVGLFLNPPDPPTIEETQIRIDAGQFIVEASVPDSAETVGETLRLLGVSTEGAFVSPDPQNPVVAGESITVTYPLSVALQDGGAEPVHVATFTPTVGAALLEAGLTLGPLDRVSPPLETPLTPNIKIEVTRINEEERSERVPIPFTAIIENDPELSWGREHIIQEGRRGTTEERVRVRLENNRLARRTLLSRTVVQEPISEIRARGTKIVIGRIVEGQASWYRFRGGMFAASTMFPRGAYLRVTNLANGKQVIVRINDYGPVAPGRVIDLDAVAFRALHPLGQGVFPARVEEILP